MLYTFVNLFPTPASPALGVAGVCPAVQPFAPLSYTHLPTANLRCQIFILNWEEAGVPWENPRRHGENMQTPNRKAPGPQIESKTGR